MKLLLTSDTRVATTAGLLKAGQLVEARDLSLLDASGRAFPGRASHSATRLVEIRTDDGAVLRVDEDGRLDDGTPLKAAINHRAQLAAAENCGSRTNVDKTVTPMRAWLAGMLLGSGYAGPERRHSGIRPAAASDHVWELRPPTPATLQRLVRVLDQEQIPFRRSEDHGMPVIQGSGETWTLFWRSLGLRFIQPVRSAPDWVWRGDNQLRLAFLRGVAAGSPPRGGQGQLASRSVELNLELRSLLRSHGYSGRSIEGGLSVSAGVAEWLRGDALAPAVEQLTVMKIAPLGITPAIRVETEGRELLTEGLVLRA